MTDIAALDKEELENFITGLGEAKYRAAQVYDWLHKKMVTSFDEMTNVSKSLRNKLEAGAFIAGLKLVKLRVSKDGTKKYLFELDDGALIESVLMKYKYGYSVCVSSQSGCRMGCTFCASTIGGLNRSLKASEMLGQVYAISREIGERISHVVVMGMGEPLDNYDATVRFIRMISDENGQNISQRNLTVSTCGLVPQMRRLADERLSITLAVSLHAPDDELRKGIMPIAKRYGMEELIDACRYYFDITGRRVTFEYSLIQGVNDSDECAKKLGRLISGMGSHINLIPVNPVRETGYESPGADAARAFKNKLEKYGINVTIRREMGRDIEGACGQLKNSFGGKNESKR